MRIAMANRFPIVGAPVLPMGQARNLTANTIETVRLRTSILDLPATSTSFGTDADTQPVGALNNAGGATLFARADHEHAGVASLNARTGNVVVAAGTGVTITEGPSKTFTFASSSLPAVVAPPAIAAASAQGSSLSFARADHTHAGMASVAVDASTPTTGNIVLQSAADASVALSVPSAGTVAFAWGLPQTTVYWDYAGGNDTNSGLTSILPVQSFARAKAVLQKLKSHEILTLQLAAGTFPLQSIGVLDFTDLRTNARQLVIQGSRATSAAVSGAFGGTVPGLYAVTFLSWTPAPPNPDTFVQPSGVLPPSPDGVASGSSCVSGDAVNTVVIGALPATGFTSGWQPTTILVPAASGAVGAIANTRLVFRDLDVDVVQSGSASFATNFACDGYPVFVNVRFTSAGVAGFASAGRLVLPPCVSLRQCISTADVVSQASTDPTTQRSLMDGCMVRGGTIALPGFDITYSVVGGPQASGGWLLVQNLLPAAPSASSFTYASAFRCAALSNVTVWNANATFDSLILSAGHVGFWNAAPILSQCRGTFSNYFMGLSVVGVQIVGGDLSMTNGRMRSVGSMASVSSGARASISANPPTFSQAQADGIFLTSFVSVSDGSVCRVVNRQWIVDPTTVTSNDWASVSAGSQLTVSSTGSDPPGAQIVTSSTGRCFAVRSGSTLTLELNGSQPQTAAGDRIFLGAVGAVGYAYANDYATAGTQGCRVNYVN